MKKLFLEEKKMKERRTCSRLKPWIYFLMELTLFGIISLATAKIITIYTSSYALLSGLTVMALLLYKSKAMQRLEFVLHRTEEIRKVKVRQKYRNQI